MSKTLLILGAGIMQLPAIRRAASFGWHVIVADGNAHAVGRKAADEFVHIDLRDRDGMLEEAKKRFQSGGLDGVFTAGTDFSTTVAWVTEHLGLPGIDYETSQKATDKILMRKCLEEGGVPVPKYREIGPEDDPLEKCAGLNFPFVVKPVDNMGARGVKRVDSPGELSTAVQISGSLAQEGRVIAEEFIDGPEFSLDALSYDGRIVVTGIADREIRFPPYFVEMGHAMPSRFDQKVLEKVETVFCEAIRALGIDHGTAKGDIRFDGREAVVGEVAARLSGGYMSGWTYPYASGYDLTGAALQLAVGDRPPFDPGPYRAAAAERAVISIPGTLKALDCTEEAASSEGVRNWFATSAPGDRLSFPSNNVQKCGNIIATADSYYSAVYRAETAAAKVLPRLEAEDPATACFLFRQGSKSYPPAAYALERPLNLQAFEEMPLYEQRGSAYWSGAVYNLPEASLENGRDWQNRSLEETLDQIVKYTGIIFYDYSGYGDKGTPGKKSGIIAGKAFWLTVLAGSLQGGVWFVDTLRRWMEEEPGGLSLVRNRIEQWMEIEVC